MHPYDKFKSDNPVPERSAFDLTKLNRHDVPKSTNLFQFDESQIFQHCTVITLDGVDGFSWYDENGTRHDEGLTWPVMQIHRDATVEVFFGPDGERSAGWRKSD